MKTLFIFVSLIALSVSFKLYDTEQLSYPLRFVPSAGCSDTRVKTVNDSIAEC